MADAYAKLDAYLAAITLGFPPKVQTALVKVQAGARRLLAIRGYLRHPDRIQKKWAWDDAEAKKFKASDEYAHTVEAVKRVQKLFAQANQGYTLETANLVRSLQDQIDIWNGNADVSSAAIALRAKCVSEIGKASYPETPDAEATAKFAKFLRDSAVAPEPPCATPGLSDHGQLHAIDFIIKKDGKTVARIKRKTINNEWEIPGWTKKLQEAVIAASPAFKGPLPYPYEPWHYTYSDDQK
jgi:hypothetical protein